MDIQQLKLLAGRVRGLLEQSQHTVSHNQSLDLIAALPGLRNWPEVLAFPDRVAKCELEPSSATRLCFRINKKFGLDLVPVDLINDLQPPDAPRRMSIPDIWPSGPVPGVYLTTSPEAIDRLLSIYEEATDGALVYAERAGAHWEGSIDLGEYGLWSGGLQRVPSGTLVIVGPLKLDQQEWERSSKSLEMACIDARAAGHRVAVLLSTPTPLDLCDDAVLMIKLLREQGDDLYEALTGTVTEEGELKVRAPFASPRRALKQIAPIESAMTTIPAEAVKHLKKALSKRSTGVIVLGNNDIKDLRELELVCDALALTNHAGPAARIMPRHRSTPSKDWDVPDQVKALPFLPSIESAFEQGYRRMVVSPYYSDGGELLEYADDVLFIAPCYGVAASDLIMQVQRGGPRLSDSEIHARVLALLCVMEIEEDLPTVCDLYLNTANATLNGDDEVTEHIENNLVLSWKKSVEVLVAQGKLKLSDFGSKEVPNNKRAIRDFIKSLKSKLMA